MATLKIFVREPRVSGSVIVGTYIDYEADRWEIKGETLRLYIGEELVDTFNEGEWFGIERPA